jgi:hypothetical protein
MGNSTLEIFMVVRRAADVIRRAADKVSVYDLPLARQMRSELKVLNRELEKLGADSIVRGTIVHEAVLEGKTIKPEDFEPSKKDQFITTRSVQLFLSGGALNSNQAMDIADTEWKQHWDDILNHDQ